MALQRGEGFSVNADQRTFTGRGYAVGGTEVRPLIEDNHNLSFNRFATAMERMASNMLDPDTQVIGGWVGEDRKAYIEVSDIVRSKAVAMELATSRNEMAIYDFQTQSEVRNPNYVSGVATKVVKNTRPEIAKTIEA